MVYWETMLAKQLKMKRNKQNGGFLKMLLDTLRASLSEHLLTSKGVKAKIAGQGVIKAGERTIGGEQYFKHNLIL